MMVCSLFNTGVPSIQLSFEQTVSSLLSRRGRSSLMSCFARRSLGRLLICMNCMPVVPRGPHCDRFASTGFTLFPPSYLSSRRRRLMLDCAFPCTVHCTQSFTTRTALFSCLVYLLVKLCALGGHTVSQPIISTWTDVILPYHSQM